MHEIRFFLMIRPPPSSTLTDTLFPDTTLFRSDLAVRQAPGGVPEDLDLSLGEQRIRPRSRELLESTEVRAGRSEEHTSELKSLMRISYAVFCLTKNTSTTVPQHIIYELYIIDYSTERKHNRHPLTEYRAT